ncbi:MAG TPA: hypothetical protein VKF15_04300 [Nitrososphaerales archaeon]|nr:hypothetical protein [Nitrososphaerales archaeon]
MKVKLLLDGNKPKVGEEELREAVRAAGMDVVTRKADIGVVVGGDGIFSMYGRTEPLPLLFVGVKSRAATGSKAYLAAAYFNELPEVLREVAAGKFTVEKHKRLKVLKNARVLGEVFTDVYLQRGAESNCIRYRVRVSGEGLSIDEAAIGDGVVVSTSAGSTGYYSYPDKINGESVEVAGHAGISGNEVGICHVVPTFTERRGTGDHPLRYTVPWGSRIEVSITRRADARLYGVSSGREGVKIGLKDVITVLPSENATEVVSLIQ